MLFSKITVPVLLTLFLFPAVSSADTNTFFSTADADIWEFQPDTNRGSDQYFQVGCGGAGYLRNSLVRFDLSGISGATVNSAVLRLMVVSSAGDFPSDDIYLARNGDDWNEMTVTWNNGPALAEVMPIAAPSVLDWWEIDVTAWVQDMVSGTVQNYGFQIYQNDTDYAIFSMTTRENIDVPELVVDYTSVILQNSTFGSIKSLLQ